MGVQLLIEFRRSDGPSPKSPKLWFSRNSRWEVGGPLLRNCPDLLRDFLAASGKVGSPPLVMGTSLAQHQGLVQISQTPHLPQVFHPFTLGGSLEAAV